jgi:hypothetical protein
MTTEPVSLAGAALDRSRGHICAFFHSEDEKYRVLLPFLKEGYERGDKLIHVTDSQFHAAHKRRLEGSGVKVETAQTSGQLELLGWEEAHLRESRFDQHAMLILVEEVLSNSRAQGFPMTRLTGDMEWALKELPGVRDLVEYEARANYILPKYQDAVL